MYIFALLALLSIGQVWGHGGHAGYNPAHAAHAAHMMKHWNEEEVESKQNALAEKRERVSNYVASLAVWRYEYRYILKYIYNCPFYQRFFELSAEERTKFMESLIAIQCTGGSIKICMPSDKADGIYGFVFLSNILFLYKRLEEIVRKGKEEIVDQCEVSSTSYGIKELWDPWFKGSPGASLENKIGWMPPYNDHKENVEQINGLSYYLKADRYVYASNESRYFEEKDKERLYVLSELLSALKPLKKKFAPSLLDKMAKALSSQGDNLSTTSSSASSSSSALSSSSFNSSTVIPGYTPRFTLEQLFREIRMAQDFGKLKEEIESIFNDDYNLFWVIGFIIQYESSGEKEKLQKLVNPFLSRVFVRLSENGVDKNILIDPEGEEPISMHYLRNMVDKLTCYKKCVSNIHNEDVMRCLSDIDPTIANNRKLYRKTKEITPFIDTIFDFVKKLLEIKRIVSPSCCTTRLLELGKFSIRMQGSSDATFIPGSPASSSSSESDRATPSGSPESSPSGSPKN